MLTHQQFLKAYLGTAQDYDMNQSIQCVDLAKLYAKEVYGVQLGVFGGTALSGWKNLSLTFDSKKWDRIEYRFPYTPSQGDIIFFESPASSGHVGIVHSATIKEISLLEQNGGSGGGKGAGKDSISIRTNKDYKKCLGWYRRK